MTTKRTRTAPRDTKRTRAAPRDTKRTRAAPPDTKRKRAAPRDTKRTHTAPRDTKRTRAAPRDTKRKRAAPPERIVLVEPTQPEHGTEVTTPVDFTQSEYGTEGAIPVDFTQPEHGTEVTISGDAGPPQLNEEIFGPPPLVQGEDPQLYKELLAEITVGVHPNDIIEDFMVHDIAYLALEVQRLRSIKVNITTTGMVNGLNKILNDLVNPLLNNMRLAERWAVGEPDAVEEVEELLSKAGLTEKSIENEAFVLRLPEIERLDRMIAAAEKRRAVAMREIHHHRAALADELKAKFDQIERRDAEFERGMIGYHANNKRAR